MPAEFFVHRHVRGKWACKCCQVLVQMTPEERLAHRLQASRPLWDELHVWLRLERGRVPDGSGIASAIDYSLNRWDALGRFLTSACNSDQIVASAPGLRPP